MIEFFAPNRHLYKSKSRKLPGFFFGSYINYKRFAPVSMVNSFEKKLNQNNAKNFSLEKRIYIEALDVSTNRLRERRADKRLSPAEKMGKKDKSQILLTFSSSV